MQLTKGAIGNLIAKYKAVLKKCHILNIFGTLAVTGMLLVSSSELVNSATLTMDNNNASVTGSGSITFYTEDNNTNIKDDQQTPSSGSLATTSVVKITGGTSAADVTFTVETDPNTKLSQLTISGGAAASTNDAKVTLNGNLTVGGTNQTVSITSTGSGVATLDVGSYTLTAANGVTLNGNATAFAVLQGSGGSVSGPVTVTKGTVDLSTGNLTILGKLDLSNDGAITYSNENTLKVASLTLAAAHNISGNLKIDVSGNNSYYMSGAQNVTIKNNGIVTITGDNSEHTYNGAGNLTFSGGASADNSSVTYSIGKFTVGTVTMDNAAATNGQIVVGGSEDGATELTAGAVSMTTSTTNESNLLLQAVGENDKITVASLSVSGNASNKLATLNLDPGAGSIVVTGTTAAKKFSDIEIGSDEYTGTVTLTGAVTVAASGSLTANQGMVVAASTTTINGEAAFAGLTLDSTADATAGNYVAQDNVTISGAGATVEVDSLTINDKTLTVETSGSLTSNGGLTMAGGTLTVTSGSAKTSGR